VKIVLSAFVIFIWTVCLTIWYDTTTIHGSTVTNAQPVHSEQIVHCDRNITYTEANKIMEITNENGTISEYYDTNGDDKIDIEAISYMHGADKHDDFPFMYIVDINLDGKPDKSYVDIGGVGDCTDIRFYQDLNSPKASWPDRDERSEGTL
jgi:hypothetical protein